MGWRRSDVTKCSATCFLTGALLFGFSLTALAQEPAEKAKPDPAKVRALPTDTKAWKGDFDGMLESRNIRVLVPYSRTLYFN
ncbi:MAG TPA: hypothetical protein VKB87_08775, partial [Myxococcaceae bacterium]|nr:hypothetical protein [Myxococcaceae bacterium]